MNDDINAAWGAPEEAPLSQVGLAEMERLAEETRHLKTQIKASEGAIEAMKERIQEIAKRVQAALETHGLQDYQSKHGKFRRVTKFSVKVPKLPEERDAFFQYLREKGIFEELITVNSRTLNAFYNAEKAAAIESGADQFSMPGIGATTPYETVEFK